MRVIGRLLVFLAVVFPLVASPSSTVAASADPAVLKCMHWQDGMNISPGVGNNPSDQVVSGHGRVYGCNKAGGGAQFTATLQMSSATCSNLSMQGEAQFEWSNGTHSSAFLSFDPASGNKFTISGSITSGEFQGLHRAVAAAIHAGLQRLRAELQPEQPAADGSSSPTAGACSS